MIYICYSSFEEKLNYTYIYILIHMWDKRMRRYLQIGTAQAHGANKI